MPSNREDAIRSHFTQAIIHLEEAVRAYFAYGTNIVEKRTRLMVVRVVRLAVLLGFFLAGVITTVYGLGEIVDRALARPGEGKLIVGFIFSLVSGILILFRLREFQR